MKPLLITLFVLSPLLAQAAPPVAPGSGTMLQQIEPTEPVRGAGSPLTADRVSTASEATSGAEADDIMDIGENGATLQIVNGGMRLPANLVNVNE